MEHLDLALLSDALADCARGFKKLKCVVDGFRKKKKTGVLLPIPEKTGVLLPIQRTTGYELLQLDKGERVCWDSGFTVLKSAFQELYGKTLRCDRFKNNWERDPSVKKGWRKINLEKLTKYFEECRVLVREMTDCLDINSRHHWYCENVVYVDEEVWAKRKSFDNLVLTMKDFRNFCIGVHESLPSLRT